MRLIWSTLAAAAVMTGGALGMSTAQAAPAVPAGVNLMQRGDGWWFTDAKGMVLYTFERDERTPGQSGCVDDCAKQWPPLAADADAKPVGGWSTIKRPDGSKQWAYNGRPIYGYAQEGGPGTSFGDGQGEAWYAAYQPIPLPMEFSITNTLHGRVLADARGMSVYTYDKDKSGKSACNDACLKDWAPMEAPLAAAGGGDWSTVKRDDGTKQWAYKGKPLYRYTHEAGATETAGDGQGKVWHAVLLQPTQTYPAWVTVQHSDAGDLLANKNGQTIYTRNMAAARRGFGAPPRLCGGDPCMEAWWHPVLADADAKPQGNWSIITDKNGTKQWAYKGMGLYLNDRDLSPGDFKGIQFGGDKAWATIMRSGIPMQGVSVGGG